MKKQEQYLTLWNDIYLTTGIPFWIADRTKGEMWSFPETIKESVHPEFFSFAVQEMEKYKMKDQVLIYYLTDSYYLMYCKLDERLFLITAPLTTDPHASLPVNFIQHFVKQEKRTMMINHLTYTNGKQIYQVSRFANLVKGVYNNSSVGEMMIRDIRHPDQKIDEQKIREMSEETNDTESMQHRYIYFENDVMKAIEQGNMQEFIRNYNRPMNPDFGLMSSDTMRQQRYLFIINLYIMSHAAVRGKVSPETAFRLSDLYCMKMDSMNSISEIEALRFTAGKDYCERVREAKQLHARSPEVDACCEYILKHIYEPIQVGDLEPVAHMNRRSLTIHFKEEIGMTIPKYVLEKKLEEAKFLLKSSNFSILQISTLLNFSSESHFISHFREHYEITPKQYRKAQDIY